MRRVDQTRRKPNSNNNRVDPVIEGKVLEYALEQPAHGQAHASNELRNITAKWKNPPREWHAAKAQFAIQFEDRFVLVV